MSGRRVACIVNLGVTSCEGYGTGSKAYWSVGETLVRSSGCGATVTLPCIIYELFLVVYDWEVLQGVKVEATLQV